jgi:CIC family chloride channel protein
VQKALNRLGLNALYGGVKTTLIAGGSAGIAAIFRAPLSGAIMGIESPYKHDLAHEALLHALVASASSFWAYTRLRPASPYFPVNFHYVLNTRDLLVAIPLGVAAGLATHLFLGALRVFRRRIESVHAPLVVRMAISGMLLVLLAYTGRWLVGEPVTLHAGLPVANALLNGKFALQAAVLIFALKLAATAVTFGGGGVGGLFVPTATIGAALGACFDQMFAASQPGVFTLLGIAAFAGASYNSVLFSAVFVAEATGNVFLVVPALVASTIGFLIAAGVSNSRSQVSRRPDWRDRLARIPVERHMTTRIVTAAPEQSLESFAQSVLTAHHYKALPVIADDGTLQGMISVVNMRHVPMAEWRNMTVAQVTNARARTLCPHHSMADAEALLRQGGCDYVPIVDPMTYQLVGVLSHSDVYRAIEPEELATPAQERNAPDVRSDMRPQDLPQTKRQQQ